MACQIVKIFFPLSLSFLAFCVSYSRGRTAAEWKSRVVYQVVTDRLAHTSKSPTLQCTTSSVCGGTFKGIQRELDYIANLGVNAIRISPFVLNTEDSFGNVNYLGRWTLDIYKINTYFGTQQDLIDLVQACHSRDIWVMADLVIRNMGYQDGCSISSCPSPQRDVFDKFVPFDKEEHYDNFNNWVNYLPRLDHTNSFVRTTLINWVQRVAADYDIDGFCLDDVDGIPKDFLEELNNSTKIFMIGHAGASGAALAEYQPALDAVFDNDMQSALSSFFARSYSNNGYYQIPDELALRRGLFTDSTVLGGYLDNVDTRRFLGVINDYTRLRNALAYLLMAEWIPFLYYGTEQGPQFTGGSGSSNHESLWPYYIEERSLYQFISTILKHRKSLFGSEVSGYQNVAQVDCSYDDKFYSFTRKTTLIVISNEGYTTTSRQYTIQNHPFDKGTELVNIFNSADKVTVNEDGTISITLKNAEPKIYSGGAMLVPSVGLFLVICMSVLYEITEHWKI